jgi:hypothetical protein
MRAKFLVKKNGVESGPFSEQEFLAMLDTGKLSPSDLICFARRWRWLAQDVWFPAEWLRRPLGIRDIRIPRSTAIVWACIGVGIMGLIMIRLLQK